MFQKSFVLCSATALLAVAVACSKSSPTPVSPGAGGNLGGEAAADGSTLKVSAPSPQSPVNGAQPQTLTLVAGTSTAQFTQTPALTYEFQILTAAGSPIAACTTTVSPSGSTATANPVCTIDLDTNFRWRVRARMGSAAGPWSSEASFRSPIGGYNTGSELYDPLYSGTTIGQIRGSVTFSSEGARLNNHDSHVRYQFPTPLTAGEISVMVKGADEGAPGDKSKIMAMQQGDDSDITTNNYRFTAELRGQNYVLPGSVSCRMIAGANNIMDCGRQQFNFDSSRWYFWKATWDNGGTFRMQIRRDGPTGAILYEFAHAMHGATYRPTPHNIYIGSPVGRAGPIDATLPGGIYKNLWVSSRPRPAFPGE